MNAASKGNSRGPTFYDIMFSEKISPLEKLTTLRDVLAVQREQFIHARTELVRDATGRIDFDASRKKYGCPIFSSWDVYGWLWTIKAYTPLSARESIYIESMMRDVPTLPPTEYWIDPHIERFNSIREDVATGLVRVLQSIARRANAGYASPTP